MRRGAAWCIALGVLAGASALPAPAAGALEPYQMVRSLQHVQDRIAGGDHAALPMQNKLLEMIDRRFRSAEAAVFAEVRNFRALLVYGMSGGNPRTIEAVLERIALGESEFNLGRGVHEFLSGRPAAARRLLAGYDPRAMSQELGAFVALIKGSVSAREAPREALDQFDLARLLAPGTLVEEAALRRTIALAIALEDGDRFLAASAAYVIGYLRSPYAGEFADSFVAGVVALHEILDMARLRSVIAGMTAEQQKVIHLRLARRGAIDRVAALTAFAESAAMTGGEDAEDADPRAELYSNLAVVTSDNIAEVGRRLRGIDRERLSQNDRRLLDAAESIVERVTADLPSLARETVPRAIAPEAPPEAPAEQVEMLDAAAAEHIAATRRRLADIDTLLSETE